MFHQNAVAYATTILAASMMHSLFYFYYVKLFLDKYHVGQMWFQISQIVYLFWNTFNDPLFGYFQDNSSWEIFKHRKKSILYGAPIYALAFLLPWFPWGSHSEGHWITGLHLMFSLCAYDTLFTFVLLAECSLFAEMSQQHDERLRLIKYAGIASVIGSTSVFISSAVSNNMKLMFNLQVFCVVVALLSWICMRYTGLYAQPEIVKANEVLLTHKEEKSDDGDLSFQSAWNITRQILANQNFLSFGIMNFFQELHGTFCTSFLIIFGDHLIPDEMMPTALRSLLYGASFFVPQLLVLMSGNLISYVGYFNIFTSCFILQMVASIMMYAVGRHHYWLMALFFLFDLSITAAASRLINLPLSDIIDEDRKLHSKKHPRSAMVFATNALVTKPSQSVAPMATVAFLNMYGYEHLKTLNMQSNATAMSQEDATQLNMLHNAMFTIVCGLPFCVCLLQTIVWSRFRLRDTHTAEAKYIEV